MVYECNGRRITLNEEELRGIYQLVKFFHMKEDVKAHIQELELDFIPDESDLADIVDRAEIALDKNDAYFEAYWLSIEAAIMEYIGEG